MMLRGSRCLISVRGKISNRQTIRKKNLTFESLHPWCLRCKVIPLPCPLLEQPKGSWQPCEYHRRETRDKGGGYSLLMARTPQSIKHCHLHLSWEVNDGRNKLVLLFPDNISIQDSPLRNGMSWRISFTKSGPSGLPNTAVFSLDALGYVRL